MRSDEAIAQARPSSGARELLGDLVLVALSGVTRSSASSASPNDHRKGSPGLTGGRAAIRENAGDAAE
jgi:hypothetical protein